VLGVIARTGISQGQGHLVEYRGLWEEHVDPEDRDDAIRFGSGSSGTAA